MNILYMHTHDSGRYLSPYGYNVPTPNLQRLAETGTIFRNAFCASPTCSPSRAAMLTSMAPHCCGMMGLAHRGFQLEDYGKHLAHYLGDKGFQTALCGVQHEAPDAGMIGYHRILDREYPALNAPKDSVKTDLHNVQLAAQYIQEADTDKPFFLSFGMQNTHRVYPSHEGYINPNYVIPPFPIADTKKNREDMADFMRSAQVADECIGILMDTLKSTGKDQNTIVLFATDHGIAMPFMKCSLFDTGIGVAMILNYPNNPAAGQAVDAIVSHLDVFPTLCDLAEVPKPEWLQGYSMLPLLDGSKTEIRDELFAEITYHAAYEPARCVRTNRYKLIRYYDYHNMPVPANTDASTSKDFLVENGWLSHPRDREMLFDLWLDPVERVNLVQDSAYMEVYNDLSKRLFSWMERTHDPLLHYRHRVPAPAGAHINPLTELQPNEINFE